MELKLRSLAASKRNINDAVSLLQIADSGFSEITNIVVRMKEINVAGSTTNLSDKERKFLFMEYEALHEELDRIANTTEFNKIPLLNGNDERVPETLILRIADPVIGANDGEDLNELRFEELRNVIATTEGLSLKSAAEFLEEDNDFEADDALDLMESESDDYATVYDEALDTISKFRATYGAMQTRLNTAMTYNEITEENIAAAKSNIADTDYAGELARLAQSNIMIQANTALMSQANFSQMTITGMLAAMT